MDDGKHGVSRQNTETRRNGRSLGQIRTLRCEASLLSRADGSAKWTQEGTEVLVGVYGPRQTATYLEDAEKATIAVTYNPKSGLPGPRERLFESIIRQTLEGVVISSLHPRTVISITLQEVSNDGAALAVALNAVNAAVADAGIPLKHIFGENGSHSCVFAGAATCAKSPNEQIVIDPDLVEEQEAHAVVTACFAIKSNQNPQHSALLATHAYGSNMTAEDFVNLKALCYAVSDKAANLFKQSMLTAYK